MCTSRGAVTHPSASINKHKCTSDSEPTGAPHGAHPRCLRDYARGIQRGEIVRGICLRLAKVGQVRAPAIPFLFSPDLNKVSIDTARRHRDDAAQARARPWRRQRWRHWARRARETGSSVDVGAANLHTAHPPGAIPPLPHRPTCPPARRPILPRHSTTERERADPRMPPQVKSKAQKALAAQAGSKAG